MRTDIKIAGYGGQGILTLSMHIITGMKFYSDRFISETRAYGPQTMGGDCWAEIVVDNEEIDYPCVVAADYAIFLSQRALNSFAGIVKCGGTIFLDSGEVHIPDDFRDDVSLYCLPVQKISLTDFNTKLAANLIMFGAFVYITNMLDLEVARKVIKDDSFSEVSVLNINAFEKGISIAEELSSMKYSDRLEIGKYKRNCITSKLSNEFSNQTHSLIQSDI